MDILKTVIVSEFGVHSTYHTLLAADCSCFTSIMICQSPDNVTVPVLFDYELSKYLQRRSIVSSKHI